jgi:hypothetical protein
LRKAASPITLISVDFDSLVIRFEKEKTLEKQKEHPPEPSEKGQETNPAHEVKNDDTGTFKRYLRLADQLLSTDNTDKDPGSSAA